MDLSLSPATILSFLRAFDTAFIRQRCFGPQQVMLVLMTLRCLGHRSYRQAIAYLYQQLGPRLGWSTEPAASSFTEARGKLGSSACRQGFRQIGEQVPCDPALAEVRLGGYLLAAVDMTSVVMPGSAAVRRHFGAPTTRTGEAAAAQGRLTLLWNVSFHRPMDWVLGPYRSSERLQALDLLQHLPSGYVVLGDRGHPSRRFFVAVRRRGSHFLVRMNSGNRCWKEVAAFLASGQREAIIQLDFGSPCDDQPGTSRPVRLLRSELPTGESAVFATSLLDTDAFPATTLITTYTARWRIEIAIREQKTLYGLEMLSARSISGIYQEVCALMIFQLLSSDLEWRARQVLPPLPPPQPTPTPLPASRTPNPPPPIATLLTSEIRFNRLMVADSCARLLFTALAQPDLLAKTYDEEIKRLWRFKTKARPGRTFPRIAKNPNSPWRRGKANR